MEENCLCAAQKVHILNIALSRYDTFVVIYSFCFSYTLCQGPMEHTVGRFWEMVWEYQISTIVMLTRCAEDRKVLSKESIIY